jgi:hypothetical protein
MLKTAAAAVLNFVKTKWAAMAIGGIGVLLFAVGFAVGVGLGILIHKNFWPSDPPPRQPAAFSEVDKGQARALAEAFRPWLLFDSDEPWRPLNVAQLLAEAASSGGEHRFCTRSEATAGGTRGTPDCHAVTDEANFTDRVHLDSSFTGVTYLDLAGDELGDYRAPTTCDELADCGARQSAVYYHVTQSNNRYYIDYWWFLRFNHFYLSMPKTTCHRQWAIEGGICDEHEGDWEGVTVVTPPDDPNKLDYVVFAAHKGTFRYAASNLRLKDHKRPVVFIARGSHAAYPKGCNSHVCPQPLSLVAGQLLTLPESRFDGGSPWERNGEKCEADVADSCLLALPRTDEDPHAWTVWPGQWGNGCGTVCGGRPGVNSPQSPGVQTRYQTPWCSSQGTALTCDGRALGCSDWLGPLVAVVACTPKTLAAASESTDETQAGTLTITVAGRQTKTEVTPGVVQVLGEPLRPFDRVTVSGGSSSTQVLIRARQEGSIVEARFSGLPLAKGRRATFTVQRGPNNRLVLLARKGLRPLEANELRIIRVVQAEQPGPASG